MNPLPDLTRWNRAGLDHFQYVDGTAVEHLELLRAELQQRLGWPGDLPPVDPADLRLGQDTEALWLARIQAQYQAAPKDMAWEIVRCFARACHVLTAHIDAYANEGYVGTATQWESLRRLTAALGQQPAPPSSARTPLLLRTRPGVHGRVARGLQVQYSPTDGGAPLLFETLDDLAVDARLDELRLQGWNRARSPLDANTLWRLRPAQRSALAAPAVLCRPSAERSGTTDTSWEARVVEMERADLDPEATTNELTVKLRSLGRVTQIPAWMLGDVVLWMSPQQSWAPQLNGPGCVRLKSPVHVGTGEVLAWQTSEDAWIFRQVEAVQGCVLRLDPHQDSPSAAADLFRALPVPPVGTDTGRAWRLPMDVIAAAWFQGKEWAWTSTFSDPPDTSPGGTRPPVGSGSQSAGWKTFADHSTTPSGAVERVYLILKERQPLGQVSPADTGTPYRFAGNATQWQAGQWAVAVYEGGATHPVQIGQVATADDNPSEFTLNWLAPQGYQQPGAALQRLLGPMRHALRPQGHDLDETALADSDQARRGFLLDGEFAGTPLTSGRMVLLCCEGRPDLTQVARVTRDGLCQGRICLDPAPELSGYTVGAARIHANVVLAGHGETQPERVLGSGNGAVPGQSFALAVQGLATVEDPRMPCGVRPDLSVRVEEAGSQWWQPVPSLRDSGPVDQHYTWRLTREGGLLLNFGDGTHGRRLPTGVRNLRVACRVGSGARGNLERGSLTRLVRPHALLAGVEQPLPAVGGADRDDVHALRRSAGAGLRALDSAVALEDFAHLAQLQAGVLHAAARGLPPLPRWRAGIEVIVVPVAPVDLDEGGKVRGAAHLAWMGTLAAALRAKALPGIFVRVRLFQPRPLHLAIHLTPAPGLADPAAVPRAVQARLLSALSLALRRIGEPLHLSRIYQLTETVPGVAHSFCEMWGPEDSGTAVTVLSAAADEVLYLDPDQPERLSVALSTEL